MLLPPRRSLFAALFSITLASVVVTPSLCAQAIWTGRAGDDNWTNGANWQGGVAPVSSASTAVQLTEPTADYGTSNTSLVNAPWVVGSLTFTRFNGYLVGDGNLTLAAGGTVTSYQRSFQERTVYDLNLGGASTWNIADGYVNAWGLTGSGPLTKTGRGVLLIGENSGFSGGVSLDAGLLLLWGANAIGTGPLTINGGSLVGSYGFPGFALADNSQTWNGNFSLAGGNNEYYFGYDLDLGAGAVTLTGHRTVTVAAESGIGPLTLTVGGAIGDGGNGYGLTKGGPGTLALTGASTFTGPLVVNAGTLRIDTTNHASALNASAPPALVFAGSGTFRLQSSSTGSSRTTLLDGLTLSGGAATIDVKNTGSQTLTLDLRGAGGGAGIARSAGGTVDFQAGSGTLGTSSIVQVVQPNVNGILGAWATVNGGTDWAANNGSDRIAAYAGYVTPTGASPTLAGDGTVNLRLTSGSSGDLSLAAAGATDVHTVLINDGTGRTIDVRNGATAGTLRFGAAGGILTSGSGAHTIGVSGSAGTITAGGAANTAGELIVTNAGALTLNSVVADNGTGAVALTKSGAGVLTLNGANTYTGGTALNTGTLALGNADALGGAGPVSFLGGTLRYDANNTVDYSGRIANSVGAIAIDTNGRDVTFANSIAGSNTGGLTKSGTGTLTLGGTNTYGGDTTVNAGTLVVTTASLPGNLMLGDFGNTHVIFNQSTNGTYAGSIMGQGQLTLAGSGTLTFTGYSPDIIAEVRLKSGTLVVPAGGELGSVLNGAYSTIGNVSGDNASMVISGGVVGSNTLFLGKAAGSTGSLSISSGTLSSRRMEVGMAGTGSLTVSGGDITTVNALIGTQAGGNGTVTFSGGTWTIAEQFSVGSGVGVGAFTLAGGTLIQTPSNYNANVYANSSVTVTSGTWNSPEQIFIRGGTLSMSGGTVSFRGSSVWDNGSMHVSGGSLTLSSVLGVEFGGSLTLSGGTLSGSAVYIGSNSPGTATITDGAWNSASLSLGTGGTLNLGAGTTVGTVTVGPSGITGAGTGTINFNHNQSAYTLDAKLTGTLAVNQVGPGTSILGGANDYAGTTTATNGYFHIDANGRLGTSALTLNGGGLKYGAAFDDLRVFTLGSNGATLDTNGHSVTYTPALTGAGAFTKTGTGTLTLAGAGDYTGATTVKAGTLALTTGGAINPVTAANLTIGAASGDNGTVLLSGGTLKTADTFLGLEPGATGALTLNTGTWTNENRIYVGLNSSFAPTGAGTLTVKGGTLTSSAGLLVFNGAINLSGGSMNVGSFLSVDNGAAFTMSGGTLTGGGVAINAGGALTSTGAISGGTMNVNFLSVAGNPTAILNVSGGTITTLAGASGWQGGTVNLTGGTWDAGSVAMSVFQPGGANVAPVLNVGTGTTAGTLTANSGGLNGAGTINFNHNQSGYTFSPAIAGTVAVNQVGTGTTILSGSNTYSGATAVTGGLLQIAADARLGNSALTLDGGGIKYGAAFDDLRAFTLGSNGATLDTGSHSVAYGQNLASSAGGLAKTGVGTLTLTGTNAYTGGTAVNGGTLALGSADALGNSGPISFGGGTLQFGASNTTDYSDRFSNAAGQAYALDTNGRSVTLASALTSSGGSLTKTGAGTLTLDGANSYSGSTTVSAGTLVLATGGAINPATAANLTVGAASGDNGTLQISGGTLKTAFTVLGDVPDAVGSLSLGSGTWNNQGDVFIGFGSNFTPGGSGSLAISGGAFTNTGALYLVNGTAHFSGGTINVGTLFSTEGGNSSFNFSGGSLTGGNVSVFSPNAAAPSINISAGTWNTNSLVPIGLASATVNITGGTITTTWNGWQGGTVNLTGGSWDAGSVAMSVFQPGGANVAPVLNLGTGTTAGTLTANSGGIAGAGTININHNQSSYTFSPALSGSLALNLIGSGTTTLTGASSYTGGTLLSAGVVSIAANAALGAANGAVTFSGGTLRATSSLTANRATALTGGGGTFDAAAGASIAWNGSVGGDGVLNKIGAGELILGGAVSHTGATTVGAGTLLVNGSISHSAVRVDFGGTLGGEGTLGAGATIASGGRLAPGNASGTLTFTHGLTLANGSILDFQLGTSSDLVRISGGTLTGPDGLGGLTLNIFNADDFKPGIYTLFDFSTDYVTLADFNLGDFSFGSTLPGFSYSLAFNGSTLELNASAIPEPSTYAALFGACVLGFAAWRRHRAASAVGS